MSVALGSPDSASVGMWTSNNNGDGVAYKAEATFLPPRIHDHS